MNYSFPKTDRMRAEACGCDCPLVPGMDSHSNKALLIVSHPGHELRVHHWLETSKPIVLVLTDGSGSVNGSRLASTTAVLVNAGARAGTIYGRFSDRELYAALVTKNRSLFRRL